MHRSARCARTFCIFLYTVAFALLTPSVIVDVAALGNKQPQ